MSLKLPRWTKVLLVVLVIPGVALGSDLYAYQRFGATGQQSIGSGVLGEVRRVGQDFWVPTDQLPPEGGRTRLAVLPVRAPVESVEEAEGTTTFHEALPHPRVRARADENQVIVSGQATRPEVTWSVRLRTIHLLEGYLFIPSRARVAYPPPATGEGDVIALQGRWYEDNTPHWLWLDRIHHRFFGPNLAEKLRWLNTGTILRIEWIPGVVVLRITGHDDVVQNEESRLVDLESLSTLRGGLGEPYRRSLQSILLDAPQGLTFAEIVIALRERQQHEIHRVTIHTLLYGGGFIQRNSRWFAVPNSHAGASQLRKAMVEALAQAEQGEQEGSPLDQRRLRIKTIQKRLEENIHSLE